MRIKYNKATIHIYGEIKQEKIKEATVMFMRNVQRSGKDGNNNKTRNIKEK